MDILLFVLMVAAFSFGRYSYSQGERQIPPIMMELAMLLFIAWLFA